MRPLCTLYPSLLVSPGSDEEEKAVACFRGRSRIAELALHYLRYGTLMVVVGVGVAAAEWTLRGARGGQEARARIPVAFAVTWRHPRRLAPPSGAAFLSLNVP